MIRWNGSSLSMPVKACSGPPSAWSASLEMKWRAYNSYTHTSDTICHSVSGGFAHEERTVDFGIPMMGVGRQGIHLEVTTRLLSEGRTSRVN
jgi:hypothetical protein